MAEIKTIKDISQSISEVPRRITKSGTVDAELTSSGEIIKSGVPGNPAIFKTIEEPQRFLGKSGLEDISLDLEDCTGKYFEFEYLCENNLIKSAFNDNTDDTPLASFIIKSDNIETEKWINYKPYNCNTASGAASSNVITYEDVYNGVDIQYENQKKDIKQYITLKDSTAQTVFDFTITTCNDIELSVEELPILTIQYTGASPEGTIEVTSGNHIIGRTQAATAFDIDLTDSSYDTLQELVDYIDGLSTWSASIETGSGTCRSKTLSVIGIIDCKTSEITLNAELKSVKAINPNMPNSRTYWQIKRPFANSNRSGSTTSYGFIELIPASEHVNGTYDVIRITINSSWVSSEFSSGATEIVIDPTTYRIIRDYGNITFIGDYSSGNQHGINGFMNGYGRINRGTEAVQTGGTRVENDNASITFIDPDGTEYAGGASTKGVWNYSGDAGNSGGNEHYTSSIGAKVKLTFTGTEIWTGLPISSDRCMFKVYIDNINYGIIDEYNSSGIYQQKFLLATGLTSESHTVMLEVLNQTNISSIPSTKHFDFFEYYTSGNELVSKDEITINGRSTYGLDCTFAKHPNAIKYDSRGNLYNDTGGDPAKGGFHVWGKMGFAYDADANKHWIFGKEADTEVSGDMRLYYDGSDDKFHFSIYNGADWTTVDAQSAAQTFSADDIISIGCSWDETLGANLYINNVKTSDISTWTAVDLDGYLVIGNDPVSPSATEEANMILSEPTFFDYVLADEEFYDIYISTIPIWEMDFGRIVEVLNRTNKGLLFNYSGVVSPNHRTGSFAGKLYDTSAPSGTSITESQVTFVGNWTDAGNYKHTDDVNAYATTTFTGTEIWACFYAGTADRGIAEYIIDEGTYKENHILIDQYGTIQDVYALIATGLENSLHTLKVKVKNVKNISSADIIVFVGLNGAADKMFIYTASGSENVNTYSMTVNNRLIDNVLKCEYSSMPTSIQFVDKGNINEYDYEGTIKFLIKTSWAGNDSATHILINTRDSAGNNGAVIYKTNSNYLRLWIIHATSPIYIDYAVNGTNWANNTEHHVIGKWWRPTSSTMGLALYLNGIKVAENKSQSFTPTVHSQITIGNTPTGDATSDAEGSIYDVSIYNHAFNDGGVAVSASAASGSEVYNAYHSICRKYKEDLSSQVGDGSTTTFYLERGLILNESDTIFYDDSTAIIVSSIKEGTYCRANGNILSTDTTIQVDSWTNSESEIDTNGGYLWIGQVNSLWRKKVEYSSYDSTSNIFTVADSGTVGEDFVDNIIIEVCGTVTVSSAPAEDSIVECTYYYSGDSVDREYGLIPDRLNKNLWLDHTGNSSTGWSFGLYAGSSGMQHISTNVKGQTVITNFNKSNTNLISTFYTNTGISQIIANQGMKNERSIIVDQYDSSTLRQNLTSLFQGLMNQNLIRYISGINKNASASDYSSQLEGISFSSQNDLTGNALLANDVNSVFDFSAVRVVDGQLDYDKDKSGNLLLAEDLDNSEIIIDIDTVTSSDLDMLGRPHGIIKIDNEFIRYEDITFSDSTSCILLNCKRGYLAELTGGTATTHSNNTSIQLVGSWRNNVNARTTSWFAVSGTFPYRALLVGCGTEGNVEGGLVIRDIDNDSNYMAFEANDSNIARGAVKEASGHTGKICISYGTLAKGFSDIDFINDEILNHGIGVGYGSAAGTKGTISQRNDELGWSYTTHIGVTLNSNYVTDIIIYFDATNYNVWASIGKSGATGTSAGINRIYDGGDGILDTEYDLDSDTSYWATSLCYDITNDDLYVSQTLGTANNDIWSKIGTPKITGDSTIDTADGSDRLTSQSICNDISIESLNVWFASDLGAKSILKSDFSSGVIFTLDSTSFTELDINECETINYDPDNQKLLIGYQDGTSGLLIECDVDGANAIYYDKTTETDVDRLNVLSDNLITAVTYNYFDNRELGDQFTSIGDNGWTVATNSGITIKSSEGVTYSEYSDPDITESNGVYTIALTGTARREVTITESNGVYTRTLDTDPNPAPMVDKIISESNGVYTSTDQS